MSTIRFACGDLPGEFQRPPGWFWDAVASPAQATILRLDSARGVVAVEVGGPRGRRGVAVWDLTGRAVWAHDWADNVRILTSDSVLACGGGRLGRYSWPDMTMTEEVDAHQYAENVVVSQSQRRAVAWLNDGQGANGYEVYALDDSLRRLGVGEIMTLDPMYSMPVFSPAERLVACSPGTGVTWWTPAQEDWPEDFTEETEIPSRGGVVTFAWLVVHDIERDAASRHQLQFDLPPGWVPEDVWDSRWQYGPIGLQFVTEDHIQVVLPDGATANLRLPLPEAVLLPTPDRALPLLS